MAGATRMVAVAIAVVGVACGSNGYGGGNGGSGGSDVAAAGSSFSVTAPSDGAKVKEPFTVKVSSSEKLGPTSSGNDHVHLYYDGSQSNYDVCTSDSCQVSGLSPGKHVIEASLRHADHSDAGPKDSITVYVGGGTGSSGGGGGSYGGGGGGGY
jgi:hypothetical protein